MPNVRLKIRRAARRYGVDPAVLEAQIYQESRFKEGVTSPAGARDIAQFEPATARAYGVTLGDNRIGDDIDGAARYMRDNLRRTGGDYKQALSIYNSGRPDGYKHIAETQQYVQKILGAAGGGANRNSNHDPNSTSAPSSYRTVPGVDNSSTRRGLQLAYLQNDHNPDALLNLALGLRGAQDTPSRQVKVKGQAGGGLVHQTGSALVNEVKAEADRINNAHVPYQWGGGHGARQPRGSKITPLDCSGAVSRVLGVDPRVSGQFAKWGKPGRGKVTVYANGTHVLMEINGHFWGTSSENPGGGPGWISRKHIPPSYLKNFVARHAA